MACISSHGLAAASSIGSTEFFRSYPHLSPKIFTGASNGNFDFSRIRRSLRGGAGYRQSRLPVLNCVASINGSSAASGKLVDLCFCYSPCFLRHV